MDKYISRLFPKPDFGNDSEQRLAFLLFHLLGGGLLLTAIFTFVNRLFLHSELPLPWFDVAFLVIHIIGLFLLRLRRLWTSAYLYTSSLWLFLFFANLLFGGVTASGTASLITVTIITGMLLGPRVGLSFAAFGILGVITASYLEIRAFLPLNRFEANVWQSALVLSINIGATAFVVRLGTQSLKESLDIASNSQSLVLQQRNQLELAAEISTRARGISNLKDLVQSVCDLIGERFNLYHVSIFKYEELEKQLLLIAESGRKGEGNKPSEFAIPISENSIIANVARTQKAYLAEDIEKDPLYLAVSNFKDVKSEISLPIVAGGKLFGVIDFLSSSEKALTWDEVNVLQILVNHIGTEINNVYLNNVRERHLEELEALHGIASAGIEATSEDELILRATQVVGESLFPRNFGVLLIDYDSGLLQHHSSYAESDSKKQPAIPLGEGITGLVALSGQSMRLADVSEEPKYISIDSDARSELCVPIKIGTRVLGVLNIESSSVNAFNQEDENLLLTLGGQLAIGLEKIRLLNEARSRADELAKVLDQNEEVNRLKGEFIQNVSHEFRTPLAIVSGYTEILNSGEFGELPSEIQQPINIIAKRVQLLNKLVDDLTSTLEVQGREKNFEVLDLAELIETLLPKIVEEASSKQIAVESEIDNSISKILGEKIFLQKAIDNLVTNAIKFNSPNGKIIIRVSERDGIIYLEVEDTGIGIPKENIERIFERFYQVDGSPTRQYSGTGLGLALVREVAQLHDGEIAVFSKLGEGSRFVFKIPIYAGKVTSKTLGRSSD